MGRKTETDGHTWRGASDISTGGRALPATPKSASLISPSTATEGETCRKTGRPLPNRMNSAGSRGTFGSDENVAGLDVAVDTVVSM